MNDADLMRSLRLALLALRLTLGVFLLQWGVEKFVVPANTVAIWSYFYGIDISQNLSWVIGVVEVAIAACLLLGVQKTLAYGAALALHTVSVLSTWRQLLDPWGGEVNHLFIAGVPVVGAFAALFLLRRWDRGVFERAAPPA